MKTAKIITKIIFFVFLIFDIALFGTLIYLNRNISSDFKIVMGDTLKIESPLPVTAVLKGEKFEKAHTQTENKEFKVDLKMFGIFPFSTASVQVVSQMQVAVLGTPFGMRIFTNGLLVTDLSDVATKDGNCNPAKSSGIKKGDYILSANGKKVTTNENLVTIVERSQGKEITLKIVRNKKEYTTKITPALCKDTGSYKIGVWVRDSSAGIGTLTFYSPADGILCGLGHGVCDEDTGQLLEINSGETVAAEIHSIEKGKSGDPGELKGSFTNEVLGDIKLNTKGGVYSQLSGELPPSTLMEIALKNNIKNGAAEILCTIDGNAAKMYSCKIEIKSGNRNSDTHNMIVTITDKELLNLTGGIVQGLSGSPIIQNGKLIGAVTHVLVDDPTKGYAIFAENMLETAQSVAEEQELKNVS